MAGRPAFTVTKARGRWCSHSAASTATSAPDSAIRRSLFCRRPTGGGLVVVRNLNPDGSRSGTRLNGRGVDLNRNFATDWRPIGVPGDPEHSGARPFSEPETRLARRLIRRLQPDVTIWFHQQAEPLVRAWGPSVPAARAYARLAGMRFARLPWMDGTAPNWQNHPFPGTSSFVVELPEAGNVASASAAGAVDQLAAELPARRARRCGGWAVAVAAARELMPAMASPPPSDGRAGAPHAVASAATRAGPRRAARVVGGAGELFRRHWRRAHRAAYLVVGDPAAAEDVAQEAFLAAIRALDRFDRRRPFGPWLHRITVNRAIDYARARGAARASTRSPCRSPSRSAANRAAHELSDELLAALAELPPSTARSSSCATCSSTRRVRSARMLDLPRGPSTRGCGGRSTGCGRCSTRRTTMSAQ